MLSILQCGQGLEGQLTCALSDVWLERFPWAPAPETASFNSDISSQVTGAGGLSPPLYDLSSSKAFFPAGSSDFRTQGLRALRGQSRRCPVSQGPDPAHSCCTLKSKSDTGPSEVGRGGRETPPLERRNDMKV